MTRKEIATVLDRLLGASPVRSVAAELQSSIFRIRHEHPHARRSGARQLSDFVDTLTRRKQSDAVLKRVRVALARVSRFR